MTPPGPDSDGERSTTGVPDVEPHYGVASMSATLRRVAVRRPSPALATADPDEWHYAAPIDLVAARDAHDVFVELLHEAGAEVQYLSGADDADDELADGMFAFDPSLLTPAGAVLLRMGKRLRRDEVSIHERFYRAHDIPIIGRIVAPGTVEAGDTLWVDEQTLAVGRGYRTNDDGIDQLGAILATIGVEVRAFDLPVGDGPDACLHLMSLISPLAPDLALVHARLLPVRLRQLLEASGYALVDVALDEFEATAGLAVNVLALAPRRCVMIDGCPETRRRLEGEGCDVLVFPGEELCVKAEGGPTCLTRPVWRR
jgi:dimethylargininase